MIRFFRQLAETVQGVEAELRGIRAALDGRPVDDTLRSRVELLEAGVDKKLAEAEGLLMRAESKLRAARSAEERERHQADRAEKAREELAELNEESLDPFEEAGRAWQFHQGNDEGSGEEGVPAVRPDVEVSPSHEQIAARRKFGG